MSDITDILQLPGAELASIERDDTTVTLHFSLFHIVREMENAFDDSLWTQAGRLVIRYTGISGELPDCPCRLAGGDLVNNIYTYRNHAPLPIDWRGSVSCRLAIEGEPSSVTIDGSAMQLERIEHPRYIRHVKK
ncbi:MAG: hypothetical protein PVI50_02190 [Gammaproteobacteria bacterium]|jgi:hypothetical protein